MKKNKMMRVASALLVAVLLTTCAISGTFAKYVSQATGSDTARVAKWGFQLEGTAMTDTFTFDLFKTVKDSDGTSTETDIKAADGSIIAIADIQVGDDITYLYNNIVVPQDKLPAIKAEMKPSS